MPKTAVCAFLVRLPAELRNSIYAFTLTETHPIRVRSKVIAFRRGTKRLRRHKAEPAVPALLATCRQIRAEALPIYYGDNIFLTALQIRPTDVSEFTRWCGARKASAGKYVKEVRVEFSVTQQLPGGPWAPRSHRRRLVPGILALRLQTDGRLAFEVTGFAEDVAGVLEIACFCDLEGKLGEVATENVGIPGSDVFVEAAEQLMWWAAYNHGATGGLRAVCKECGKRCDA